MFRIGQTVEMLLIYQSSKTVIYVSIILSSVYLCSFTSLKYRVTKFDLWAGFYKCVPDYGPPLYEVNYILGHHTYISSLYLKQSKSCDVTRLISN